MTEVLQPPSPLFERGKQDGNNDLTPSETTKEYIAGFIVGRKELRAAIAKEELYDGPNGERWDEEMNR